MEAEDFDAYSPSLDVIAMVMMAALVQGSGYEVFNADDEANISEQAYAFADALKARRDQRYVESLNRKA